MIIIFNADVYICASDPSPEPHRRQKTGPLQSLCCLRSHSATRRAARERRTGSTRRATTICGNLQGGLQLLPQQSRTARRIVPANVCYVERLILAHRPVGSLRYIAHRAATTVLRLTPRINRVQMRRGSQSINKKLFTTPNFPSRARLAGLRWHLKPKLAHEAVVAGLEVRTRLALFCHYSIPPPVKTNT